MTEPQRRGRLVLPPDAKPQWDGIYYLRAPLLSWRAPVVPPPRPPLQHPPSRLANARSPITGAALRFRPGQAIPKGWELP